MTSGVIVEGVSTVGVTCSGMIETCTFLIGSGGVCVTFDTIYSNDCFLAWVICVKVGSSLPLLADSCSVGT